MRKKTGTGEHAVVTESPVSGPSTLLSITSARASVGRRRLDVATKGAHPVTRRTVQGAQQAPVTLVQHLLDELARLGVRHAFAVPGLQIDPLMSALASHATVRPILASHELAAGYMADGYARASGMVGAAFSIGGPGAANMLGAALAAKADRSPIVFVTGNIPLGAQGYGEFQDAGPLGSNDNAVYAASIGVSYRCETAADALAVLEKAKQQLLEHHPVHIAIAMDVQQQRLPATPEVAQPPARVVRSRPAQASLLASGRVLLVAGTNAVAIATVVYDAAMRFCLPVATDTGARGVVPEASPHAVGHFGFMPHPRARQALTAQDDSGAERVVAIDCGEPLLSFLRSQHNAVVAISSEDFIAWTSAHPTLPSEATRVERRRWLQQLAATQRPSPREVGAGELMSYAGVVECVSTVMPANTVFVVDAGQVRRIAVARLQCMEPRTLFSADGMAPMGWSLGAAIGARLAVPDRPVVALVGDGSMCMHGIELATAARYALPIVYVLFDNGAFGSVLSRMRRGCETETALLPVTDWCAYGRALGVDTVAASDLPSLRRALEAGGTLSAPRLIVVKVPGVDADAFAEPTGIDWRLAPPGQAPEGGIAQGAPHLSLL